MEKYETVIGRHFFNNINFPRVFISIICDKNDVVSTKYDGDDDGKTDDVSAYVLLV